VCLTLACASEKKASMSDAQPVNGAKMECSTECSNKAECTDAMKAECATKSSECTGEKKVCPMTGKVQG